MYTSTEDARSDLFLSGAVFLFGGVIVQALLRIVPLDRIPGVRIVVSVVLPLVTTVLVPYLLIRYRKEPWSMYGLAGFSPSAFGLGVVLGIPLAIAGVLAAIVAGSPPGLAIPLAGIADSGFPVEDLLARIARWLGYVLLAAYGTVKARDAFRGEHQTLAGGARQIALVLGGAAGIAAALLLLSLATQGRLPADLPVAAELLLRALGVATAVVLMLGRVRGAVTTTRPTLVTPAVLLGMVAIRGLRFDAVSFVTSVYIVGLLALLGLVVGMLQESRRTAWGAVGLGLTIATLTTFV